MAYTTFSPALHLALQTQDMTQHLTEAEVFTELLKCCTEQVGLREKNRGVAWSIEDRERALALSLQINRLQARSLYYYNLDRTR
jgi:hypothetical protein